MIRRWRFGIFPGILILIAIVLILGLLLVKGLWVWIIPDLFPEAASQGLIAEDLTWFTSFKVAIVLALFCGFVGGIFRKGRIRRDWKRENSGAC